MAITTAEKKKFLQKGAEQVDEGLPGWFGTFADMMTLLFAFFVLLAAMSTIDPVKYQEMADSMGKSVGKKIKVDNHYKSNVHIECRSVHLYGAREGITHFPKINAVKIFAE